MQKFNLDGFNFRRALDSSQVNASSEQMYQLSLYIQSDATIEQKTDSKVTIQCSSQTTKNIVFEQNVSSDYSRKVETSPSKNRTIIPSGSLTVDTQQLNETLLSGPVPSGRIDILRGRVPFVKLIERSVELGDDLTAIIRAKTTPGKPPPCFFLCRTHQLSSLSPPLARWLCLEGITVLCPRGEQYS